MQISIDQLKYLIKDNLKDNNHKNSIIEQFNLMVVEIDIMKNALFDRNKLIQDLDQEIQGLDKDIEELNDKIESLEHDVHLTEGLYNALKVKYNECVKNYEK